MRPVGGKGAAAHDNVLAVIGRVAETHDGVGGEGQRLRQPARHEHGQGGAEPRANSFS